MSLKQTMCSYGNAYFVIATVVLLLVYSEYNFKELFFIFNAAKK